MKGKKILMFLEKDYPFDLRVEREATKLRENGNEVHLYCMNFGEPIKEDKTSAFDGIHRYAFSKLTYKLSALVYTFPFYNNIIFKSIHHCINEVRPDVLHIHDMVLAKVVMKVNSKNFGLKVVLDLHENRPEIMKHYKHVNTFSGKLLISLSKWEKIQAKLVKEANRLILVTDEAREYYAKKYKLDKTKIFVVPNTSPINEDFIDHSTLNIPSEDIRVLYIGDTSKRRGVDTVLKAIKIVSDAGINVIFEIVGSSSYDESLKKIICQLNLQNQVISHGWQSPENLPGYIKRCHIGVSPIKRNIHHDTTFANKIFQYMVYGKALLVSDCPPQARVVTKSNGGIIFEANNPKDCAEKLMYLVKNREELKIMGENNIEAVQKYYNWDLNSKELIELYKNIN